MLKVLEEPPEHVRFVFCTTEPHKVIEAIRSRCQRHDFRRIRTAALVQDFARICEAEGVDIEPAALELVARAADGSHRDGLSRLDQVLTFAGQKVTLADVAQVLGALPVELRFDLAEALAAHRVADVLACVERVVDAGHDLHQFTREALEHLRDLYVLRVAPSSTTLVDVTAETRERLAAQAERFGPGELGRMVALVGDLYLDLRTATDQRLVVEVGLARAAVPEASLDAEALLARIERLERRLSIAGAEGPGVAEPTERKAAAPMSRRLRPGPPRTRRRRPRPVRAMTGPLPGPRPGPGPSPGQSRPPRPGPGPGPRRPLSRRSRRRVGDRPRCRPGSRSTSTWCAGPGRWCWSGCRRPAGSRPASSATAGRSPWRAAGWWWSCPGTGSSRPRP
jgi:DNA polymerase-3 subunit gamma/tau